MRVLHLEFNPVAAGLDEPGQCDPVSLVQLVRHERLVEPDSAQREVTVIVDESLGQLDTAVARYFWPDRLNRPDHGCLSSRDETGDRGRLALGFPAEAQG